MFVMFVYLTQRFTKLPVILKGILTKEDALLAVETGCKGIIVSNHGARQLDTVAASVSYSEFSLSCEEYVCDS